MDLSRFESLTLVAAVLGAGILDAGTHSMGAGSAAVGDLAILLALFTFDSSTQRSGAQSLAFGGASGFCALIPLLFLAKNILGAVPPDSVWFLPGAWLIATLILFGVDRFRMSARDNVSLAEAGLAGATPMPITSSAQPSTYRPAPIRVNPAPSPAAFTALAFTPAPPQAPPPVSPLPQPAFPIEAPDMDFSATTVSVPPAPPAQATAPPPYVAPDVTAIPPGREALIYLNLVGEGLNVLRTVRAENLGRDYYRIADVMPEGEQWEFTPGQVVKCRKKSLSNGKHMVAYEEAPRAQ